MNNEWNHFKQEITTHTKKLQRKYNQEDNTEINTLLRKLQTQEDYTEIRQTRRNLYNLMDHYIIPEIHLVCSVNRKTKDGVIFESMNATSIKDITNMNEIRELLGHQQAYCHDERYHIEFIMEKCIRNNTQYGGYTTLDKIDCTEYITQLINNMEYHTAYELTHKEEAIL